MSSTSDAVRWAYLTTAPDQIVAEMWRDMLAKEGVPARVRPGDVSTFLGVSSYPCRILVAEDQLETARELGRGMWDNK